MHTKQRLSLPHQQKPVVIFGAAVLAEMALFYFKLDTKRRVAGFVVDRKYYSKTTFMELPVAPFDEIVKQFPPEKYEIFIALGPIGNNRVRTKKIEKAKKLGYRFVSYISSRAKIGKNVKFGEHVMILGGCQIGAGSRIGDDVILQTNCFIGRNVRIGNHVYMYPRASVQRNAIVTPYRVIQSLSSINNFDSARAARPTSAKIKAAMDHACRALNVKGKKTRPGLRALSDKLEKINILMNNFVAGYGTKKDFRRYVSGLYNAIPMMPLWLAALYDLTTSNLPRWRLLGRDSLMYEGIFADKKKIKRLIADQFERKLKLSPPSARRLGTKRHNVLFNMPNVDINDTNIVNMAKIFCLIRNYWPDANFYLLVGDDFYFSPRDVFMFWKKMWRLPDCVCTNISPSRRHSLPSRPYIERVFKEFGVDVEIFMTEPEDLYETRMKRSIEWVQKINPAVVLSLSIDSVLDTPLYRRYPTVRFSTGEFNAIFPTDADLYVTPHQISDLIPILRENDLDEDIPTYRHVHFPVKALDPQIPATRKAYRLSENIFYIATISRHFEVGVFEDVCAEIKAFLDRHKDARWLLVGIYKHRTPPLALRHKRIRKIPECPDGIALTRIINVMIPVTPGTGITTIGAMHAGVPVLALARRPSPFISLKHEFETDAGIFLGPQFAIQNAKELGKRLEKLYSDKDYYKQYGNALAAQARKLIKERDNAAAEQFGCILEGIKRYKQRSKQGKFERVDGHK